MILQNKIKNNIVLMTYINILKGHYNSCPDNQIKEIL
jgi:hypothetical protein